MELSYRPTTSAARNEDGAKGPPETRSLYLGWTGMPSQTRLAPLVGRDGIQGGRGGRRQEQETATVELDSALARMLGITEGVKVCGYDSAHLDRDLLRRLVDDHQPAR